MEVGDPSKGGARLAGNGAAPAAILGPTAGHSPAAGITGGGGITPVGAPITGPINPATASSAGWWTPTSTIITAPANTDVMNQLCRVCGEPAAGFHFGAFTCEGCKSFFGRTYNNLGSISECKNGGACVINKKNRTACKACRLRKCLMVGMSKSGSRYGRRSNWFKIHCLLQEQTHQAQARFKDSKASFEKVLNSLDAANNNSSSNNNGSNPVRALPGSLAGSNSSGNNFQSRLKLEEPRLRPQDVASPSSGEEAARAQLASRPGNLLPGSHPLLRPEASRFPMWRPPAFFHPAISPMHLLNPQFFSFQQRFVLPYVNQVGAAQIPVTSLSSSSSSSESLSPRSTPSPKAPTDPEDCPAKSDDRIIRATSETSRDKSNSLAFLRSLGPEQDAPMDLSAKNNLVRMDANPEITLSSGDEAILERMEETPSDEEHDDASQTETGPPLDLTTRT